MTKMEKQNYKLLAADGADTLSAIVETHISDGYQPFGNPLIVVVPKSYRFGDGMIDYQSTTYFQAVTLK